MKNYFNIEELEPEKIVKIKIKPRCYGILIYELERIAKECKSQEK